MTRPSLSQAAGALMLAFVLGAAAATAETLSISGAPVGQINRSIGRTPALSAGLDDLLRPLDERGPGSAAAWTCASDHRGFTRDRSTSTMTPTPAMPSG